MKRILLSLGCVAITVVCAVSQGTNRITADSLAALSRDDGSQYLLWKAGRNTTVGTIMASSGVSHERLVDLNPIMLFRPIESGDLLLVPLDTALILDQPQHKSVPVWYTVKPGETVFSLCRRRFGTSETHFVERNKMTMPELGSGQSVIVGWLRIRSEEDDLPTGVQDYLIGPPEAWDELISGVDSLQVSTERGVAFWNKSQSDANLFAMHRAAPVNTYILITNPMFGRSVKAKVVGTIPPTYPDDVSVIITPGVAKELGAIDSRFYAEMSYVSH